MARQEADVSTPTSRWYTMMRRWDLIEAIMGGTEVMRRRSDLLPRHSNEKDEAYSERLDSAVLFNMVEHTLDTLVGKPFSERVKVNEDVPDAVSELLGDVDMQGNDVNVFCRNWFRQGLLKGFGFVLVDFPTTGVPEGQAVRTLEDDRRERVRPYWVFVAPENVIALYTDVVEGRERVTHARIRKCVVERRGWEEVEVEQVWVLEPGVVQVWQRVDPSDPKSEWHVVDERTTSLDVVPLVPFYTDRTSMAGLCKPPLLDLAYLNLQHWQSSSDQQNILTVARFPLLAASGISDEDAGQIVIGPRRFLTTPDPSGRWYYVNHNGEAINAGRQALADLEEKMSSYGAEFLKRKPTGYMTATARTLDSAESLSRLQSMVYVFMDAVSEALDLTAQWLGLGGVGGTIQVNTEFGVANQDNVGLQVLMEARKSRDISRKSYLAELRRRNIVVEEFDEEEDLEQLLEENTMLADLHPADLPQDSTAGDKTNSGGISGEEDDQPQPQPDEGLQ